MPQAKSVPLFSRTISKHFGQGHRARYSEDTRCLHLSRIFWVWLCKFFGPSDYEKGGLDIEFSNSPILRGKEPGSSGLIRCRVRSGHLPSSNNNPISDLDFPISSIPLFLSYSGESCAPRPRLDRLFPSVSTRYPDVSGGEKSVPSRSFLGASPSLWQRCYFFAVFPAFSLHLCLSWGVEYITHRPILVLIMLTSPRAILLTTSSNDYCRLGAF